MRTVTTPEACVPLPANTVDWEKEVPYLFGSIKLVIEYLAGDTRAKSVGDGMIIRNEFPVAYGRILDTTDLHGEEIDCYLSSLPEVTSPVYVIDQIDPATGLFDEHKVMIGFSSIHEVFHTYNAVFSDGSGPGRIGFVTTFTPDALTVWLATEGAALRPASTYKAEGVTTDAGVGIRQLPGISKPAAPRDEVGGIVVELPDLSRGPRIKTVVKDNESFDYHLHFYGPVAHEVWSNPVDILCRVMDYATERDTVHLHIASPGGSVILMGRMISAMNRTKAKVITYAEGTVASAATAIWCAGHERHILPGAYFMQHMSSQLLAGKTTDIQAKAVFCVDYIGRRLQGMVNTGLFTQEEMRDMVDKSSDVYVSGREAIARMGAVSYRQ